MKYILVTVRCDKDEPPNSKVAMFLPINGVAFAKLIPITAAPYAKLSQGSKYPEYPNITLDNLQFQNHVF